MSAGSQPRKWDAVAVYKCAIYVGICLILLLSVDNRLFDAETGRITLVLGLLGIWRYSWWFTHFVRAKIYEHRVYPRLRREADAVWASGYRPTHVHFMMTTYKEDRAITEGVIESICRELRDNNLPGTIWLGSGDRYDEDIIGDYITRYHGDLDLNLVVVRQNVSGKRAAIGLVLRAMSRHRIGDDDIIAFMDGDFVLDAGLIRKCAPLFVAYPDLQALTTGERVIVHGPRWVYTWLIMRFAQRHMVMQSHAVSGRVLTLTGRCSLFRACQLRNLEFIRTLEADHLSHWLWGSFRFLSGDDKSTWFTLLKRGCRMLYVPDANGYTIEHIEGLGLERMVQNFRRWSGNMLRNGSRAIALGPRRMPFFIWWCLIDQRLSMWTMLVSPALAVCAAVLSGLDYLLSYIVFIMISRFALSLIIFKYCDRVYIAFPFILYFNQLINASVKVYCIFRLHKQRWSNRGNQAAGDGDGLLYRAKEWMARWLTALHVAMLLMFVIWTAQLLALPDWETLRLLFA